VRTIRQGHGATVSRKSLIVVNYLGQIWRGKVFDSSYSKTLFGVPIGVGQVIAGWDDGLVGKRVGSRVLLVIPPKFGYGAAGKSQAGIKGTDTLTFVVDIVADYTKSIHGDLRAKRLTTSVGGVSVSPALAGVPKVTVAKRARLPKGPSVTLLARGHGPKIKAGLIVCQTLVTNWRGAVQASTWAIGSPDGETVGQRTQPSLLDKVIGNPVGSRFLALIPKTGASGPYAVVLIVAAQPHGTTLQHS
jgi:peptidylprolyl isomerase